MTGVAVDFDRLLGDSVKISGVNGGFRGWRRLRDEREGGRVLEVVERDIVEVEHVLVQEDDAAAGVITSMTSLSASESWVTSVMVTT